MASKTKSSAKKITKKVASKKAAKPEVAVESPEVPEAVVSIAKPVKIKNSEAKPFSPSDRDRRMNPEGRRGRFAEKTPPGTRTKMIKIIYDRKAELQEQRRKMLVIKLTFAAIIIGCIYYGSISLIDFTSRTTQSAIEALEIDHWWDTVAKPHSKSQTTNKSYKAPNKNRVNRSTISAKRPNSHKPVLRSSKKAPKRRTYKKNR